MNNGVSKGLKERQSHTAKSIVHWEWVGVEH